LKRPISFIKHTIFPRRITHPDVSFDRHLTSAFLSGFRNKIYGTKMSTAGLGVIGMGVLSSVRSFSNYMFHK